MLTHRCVFYNSQYDPIIYNSYPTSISEQVIQRESWEHIKDEDIKKATASFCGEIWQVPPMFSAIKVRFLQFINILNDKTYFADDLSNG